MTPADIEDLFAGITPVTIKRMFGGLGIYRDDRIFGLVAYDELFLKADAESAPAFAAAGSTQFIYEGGKTPVAMPYWRLPAEAFDDADVLARFTHLAFEAAARAGPPKKKTRRTAKPAARSRPSEKE